MSIRSLMISMADIESNTGSSSASMGQNGSGWTKAITQAPCRVQPYDMEGKPNFDFNTMGKETFSRIHFSPPVSAERNNRIVITGGPSGVGQIWEIIRGFDADTMGLFTVYWCRLYGKGLQE